MPPKQQAAEAKARSVRALRAFFVAALAQAHDRTDPVGPYMPRVLITANDRRRAGLQGPPGHLVRRQAAEEQQAAAREEGDDLP